MAIPYKITGPNWSKIRGINNPKNRLPNMNNTPIARVTIALLGLNIDKPAIPKIIPMTKTA
jgi:hypothetical protein